MNFKNTSVKENSKTFLPKYTICICNYNMGDTLKRSLLSILDQVDNDYEILIVDDGSNDNSIDVIKNIMVNHSNLRLIRLKRNKDRGLGITRNISIKEAKGKYVILHIDADDLWEPYIKTFVYLFHKLENLVKKDFLLSGEQINIGKKTLLLKYGPYRNLNRSEDRDMWHRLAAKNLYIPVKHIPFRKRMKRKSSINVMRVFRNTWCQLIYEFRRTNSNLLVLFNVFKAPFIINKNFSLSLKILRIIYALPALFKSNHYEDLTFPRSMPNPEDFLKYRKKVIGTFPELFKRYGYDFNILDLKEDEIRIFNNIKI